MKTNCSNEGSVKQHIPSNAYMNSQGAPAVSQLKHSFTSIPKQNPQHATTNGHGIASMTTTEMIKYQDKLIKLQQDHDQKKRKSTNSTDGCGLK